MWMIRGPPRAPDRLLESFGTRAPRSKIFETMMGACGPINSGGSATDRRQHPAWGSSSPIYQVSYYLLFLFILFCLSILFILKKENLENQINIFLL